MITKRFFYVLGLILFGCSALTPTVNAFYNPQPGRWLNRDPIEEKGFQFLTKNELRKLSEDSTLYEFVNNSPTHTIDLLGLKTPGKLCVSAVCTKEELKNFRYIPENDCKLLPIEPGKCYELDALYAPGSAVKISDYEKMTLDCACSLDSSRRFKKPIYDCTLGGILCKEWKKGAPNPPVDNWPCGGKNPQFPPYETTPPE